MTEPETIERTKIVGSPPKEITINRESIAQAIDNELRSIACNDRLKAIKFGSGDAIDVGEERKEFLVAASVEPTKDNLSDGPPMRARVLNVIVTVRNDKVDVVFPFYSER